MKTCLDCRAVVTSFVHFYFNPTMIGVAIAVVIGNSFSTFIYAIVDDLLLPCLGFLVRAQSLSSKSITMAGNHLQYGDLILNTLTFFFICFLCYFCIVLPSKKIHQDQYEECHFCKESITIKALKCKFCASMKPLLLTNVQIPIDTLSPCE